MHLKSTYIPFLLLMNLGWGSAQQTWTLDDCVAYALEHNLQLKDKALDEASNQESYRQSFREFLPGASASVGYGVSFGRSTDPFTNDVITTDFFSNSYSIGVSIDLFTGFQRTNAIKANQFILQASKEETIQEKYTLAFEVMQAFYDIRFFYGLIEISEEQLALSQANQRLVSRQIELGIKAKSDRYEAESVLIADKLNVTQSKNKLEAAKLRLMQIMNLKDASDITIQSTDNTSLVMKKTTSIDSVFTKAISFLPLVKAKELRIQGAEKQMDVARGGLYPSLSFYTGASTGFYETTQNQQGSTIPFADQFRNNASQYISFSLSIPISNRWATRSRIQHLKIEQFRSKNQLEIQEQELYQTIQKLILDQEGLEVEYEQSEQKLEAQKLAFTIAQKKYEQNLISILELSTVKNALANAQNEYLQVQLKSEINKVTLDFYRGIKVFDMK